jgi:hypothetical protein
VVADRLLGVGHLALVPLLQLAQELVAHGAAVEAGGGEGLQQHVARLSVSRRCFQASRSGSPRQQRAGAELEGDGAEVGVVDPVLPLLQPPDAAGHDDRHLAQAELAHLLAQLEDAGEGVLRLARVLGVGEAVVAAGEPGVS